MLPVLLVGAVVALAGDAASAEPEALAAYRGLADGAGRDADAQVRLALWCDAHGLDAERVRHLARAVLARPDHPAARGLLGLVSYAGKWKSPQQVAEAVRGDEALTAALAEYNARRDALPETAEAHWKLALWCESKGLAAEAQAHLTAVTRLDPARDLAWKHLGYRKVNGQWKLPEQAAAERAEAEAQRRADAVWRKRLENWRHALAQRGKADAAEAGLAGVSDPRAVRAVWAVFARGDQADQERAVQLFGQIDAPAASAALATLAVGSDSPRVRARATETLARRDPRDFVDRLIGRIRSTLKYEVRFVGGPGQPGALFVEGERFNIRRIYTAPLPPAPPPGSRAEPTPFEQVNAGVTQNVQTAPAAFRGRGAAPKAPASPSVGEITDIEGVEREVERQRIIAYNWREASRAAQSSEQQLENDVAAVQSYNAYQTESNRRARAALKAVTGQDLGDDNAAWSSWWADQRGYAYRGPSGPRPTIDEVATEYQPLAYQPLFVQFPHHSCFAAGTPVRTPDGTRPIETLKLGDRVLSQDTTTGALSFQPVLRAYHNPPAATLRVDLGGEGVVATPIHRFWRVGKGWAMARDLAPGDAVRTLGGTARVVSVEAATTQPVFNLEVAGGHDFFVGRRAALVHDNSLVTAPARPFDAGPGDAPAE